MARKQQETVLCQICKKQKKTTEVMPAQLVHEPLVETIRKTYPDWSSSGFICISDLTINSGQSMSRMFSKGIRANY